MREILTAVGIIVTLLFILIYKIQRKLIYFPSPFYPSMELYGATDLEEIQVQTEDSLTLIGWYRKAINRPTILFFHGNASHIGQSARKLRNFINKGYGVLLCEYRGYASNPGTPTEQGLYKDARAFMKWLKDNGVYEENIILYGQSLGTGVAVELASKMNVYSLILESPYTSFTDLAKLHYFFIPFTDLLILDRYSSIDKIESVKCPILILHGRYDTVVPYSCAEKLYSRSRLADRNLRKELHSFNAGHNDLFERGGEEVIENFLSRL